MKKIICLIMLLTLITLVMCSCNQGCGIGSLDFTHLHYNTYHDSGCININKWYNNESGIEVHTVDGAAMFFSEGTYIMVENKRDCPFCN